ncbi:MAG TPA: hypothetical protein VF039_05700, partial [Longimicrobiales bacterium]
MSEAGGPLSMDRMADEPERHCVTAGDYIFTLWDGIPGNGNVLRTIPVTYVQTHKDLEARNDSLPGRSFAVEASLPYVDYAFNDLVISIDVDTTAQYTV